MVEKTQNHYEVLGLWRDASETDIRRAYRRLAKHYHPDVCSDPDADERFRAIDEAYDVLSNPASRASFDATLGAGAAPPSRPQSDRDSGVPGGWTPPWVQDWNVESWLRASSQPPLWSARALWLEARRSWRTLGGYFALLMFVIAVCALLDRAIPQLGSVVMAAVFSLPFFIIIFSILRTGREPKLSVHRERRFDQRS